MAEVEEVQPGSGQNLSSQRSHSADNSKSAQNLASIWRVSKTQANVPPQSHSEQLESQTFARGVTGEGTLLKFRGMKVRFESHWVVEMDGGGRRAGEGDAAREPAKHPLPSRSPRPPLKLPQSSVLLDHRPCPLPWTPTFCLPQRRLEPQGGSRAQYRQGRSRGERAIRCLPL